jgi:hypothetical protein
MVDPRGFQHQPLVAYFQDCAILHGSGSGNDVCFDSLDDAANTAGALTGIERLT